MESYCIYKDDISTDLSPEHVIPLALGGCNQFVIQADRQLNNIYGTALDGKMANSLSMGMIRQVKGYVGHSKKAADPVMKKAEKDDTQVRLRINDPNQEFAGGIDVSIFHPREAKWKDEKLLLLPEDIEKHPEGEPIKLTFDVDTTMEMAFVAKVLLAAGFFLYGDDFVQFVNHGHLRGHIKWYLEGASEEAENHPDRFEGRACMPRLLLLLEQWNLLEESPFNVSAEAITLGKAFNSLAHFLGGSSVIFYHGSNQLIGTVSIGGHYIGTIAVQANMTEINARHRSSILSVNKKRLETLSFDETFQACRASYEPTS